MLKIYCGALIQLPSKCQVKLFVHSQIMKSAACTDRKTFLIQILSLQLLEFCAFSTWCSRIGRKTTEWKKRKGKQGSLIKKGVCMDSAGVSAKGHQSIGLPIFFSEEKKKRKMEKRLRQRLGNKQDGGDTCLCVHFTETRPLYLITGKNNCRVVTAIQTRCMA